MYPTDVANTSLSNVEPHIPCWMQGLIDKYDNDFDIVNVLVGVLLDQELLHILSSTPC